MEKHILTDEPSQAIYDDWVQGWASGDGQYLSKIPEQWRKITGEGYNLERVIPQLGTLMAMYAHASEKTRLCTATQELVSIEVGRQKQGTAQTIDELSNAGWITKEEKRTKFSRKRYQYVMYFGMGRRPIVYSAYMMKSGTFTYLTPTARDIYIMALANSIHPLNAIDAGFYAYGPNAALEGERDTLMVDGCKIGDFNFLPSSVLFDNQWHTRLGVTKDTFRRAVKELMQKGFLFRAEDVFNEKDGMDAEIYLSDPDGMMVAIRPFPEGTEEFKQHLVEFNKRVNAARASNSVFNGPEFETDRKTIARGKAPLFPARPNKQPERSPIQC